MHSNEQLIQRFYDAFALSAPQAIAAHGSRK